MTSSRLNVFLIGPMGAGKTTVGKRLAKATGREFVDSDAVLCERTGVSIAETFAHEGEKGFRRRERRIIEELTQRTNIVLASGGGAVLDAENRRVLGARGLVVYLCASPQTQWRNIRNCRNRPLLQNDDPQGTLAQLFAERDPLYRELCDFQVDVDQLPPHASCQKIVERLESPFG